MRDSPRTKQRKVKVVRIMKMKQYFKFMESDKISDGSKDLVKQYQELNKESKKLLADAAGLMTSMMVEFADMTDIGKDDETSAVINEISGMLTKGVGILARQQELSDEMFLRSVESYDRQIAMESKINNMDKMLTKVLAKLDDK